MRPASYAEDLLQRCLAAKGHQADPYYRIGTMSTRGVLVIDWGVFEGQERMVVLRHALAEEKLRNELGEKDSFECGVPAELFGFQRVIAGPTLKFNTVNMSLSTNIISRLNYSIYSNFRQKGILRTITVDYAIFQPGKHQARLSFFMLLRRNWGPLSTTTYQNILNQPSKT